MDTNPPCPLCKGALWKYTGSTTVRACVCLKLSMLDTYLGPDLAGAPRIRQGPLYAIDGDFKTTLDRTSENLYLKSSWHRLVPHLRLAIGHRHWLNAAFRFSVITDERIKNVFVGNESYRQKSRESRDEKDSFNGLKDLVESEDLLIVRLGFLGYKNIAAPGALKEALMIRDVAHKPTWVVQNPETDFPKSWDEEVSGYIHEHFSTVDIHKLVPGGPEPAPTMGVEDHHEPEPPTPRREYAPNPARETESPSMMSTEMSDKKPYKGKGKTFPKKKKRTDDEGGDGGGFSGEGGMPV